MTNDKIKRTEENSNNFTHTYYLAPDSGNITCDDNFTIFDLNKEQKQIFSNFKSSPLI